MADIKPMTPTDPDHKVFTSQTDEFIKENASIDPIIIAWMMILQSVSIGQDNAVVLTKALNESIQKQDKLIGLEAGFDLHTIPASMLNGTVSQTFLNNMMSENQVTAAIVNVLENKQGIQRQIAQITATSVNTSVNETQQSTQQGSGLLQMLSDLTNQISRL